MQMRLSTSRLTFSLMKMCKLTLMSTLILMSNLTVKSNLALISKVSATLLLVELLNTVIKFVTRTERSVIMS